MTRAILLAIFTGALSFAQPAQTTAISGRVTDTAGQPLRKVTLTLRANGTGVPQPAPSYIATADAQGNYSFDGVEPGSYLLSTERAGYLGKYYRSTPRETMSQIAVAVGQRLAGINIAMTRAVAISGKVLDAEGDPVANVQVSLLRRTSNSGAAEFTSQRSVSTDSAGRYEIPDLAGGLYFLSARGGVYDTAFRIEGMRAVNSSQAGLRNNPAQPTDYYATTYYPSEIDRNTAQSIRIATGQGEVTGIVIHLRRTPAFLVKGKVSGVPQGQPLGQFQLLLSRDEMPPAVARGRNFGIDGAPVQIAKDGTFDSQGLRFPAGNYVLSAVFMPQGIIQVLARQAIVITDHDLVDAVLTFEPLLELRGTVGIEGRPQTDFAAYPAVNPPLAIITTVTLQAADGASQWNSNIHARIQSNGAFTIANVAPGTYMVRVFGVPSGTYVKSIRLGGREVKDAGAEFTETTAGSLQITLSEAVGSVSGVILTDDGKPMANCSVTLMSEPYEMGGMSMLTGSDRTGHFTTWPLPPGTYRVYAFEDLDMAQHYDPDFQAQFESRSVKVTVKENSVEQVTLRPIPPAPL